MTAQPEKATLLDLMTSRFLRIFERFNAHHSEGNNDDYVCSQIKEGRFTELHTTRDGKIYILIMVEDDRTKSDDDKHSPTGVCCK